MTSHEYRNVASLLSLACFDHEFRRFKGMTRNADGSRDGVLIVQWERGKRVYHTVEDAIADVREDWTDLPTDFCG